MFKGTLICGFFLAMILSLLLSGCGGGDSTTATGNRRFGPLEFALTTTKTTFARGEQVPLTFTVKNTSQRTVTAIGGGCVDLWRVIQGGRDITPPSGCGAAGYMFTFAPGETKTFNDTLDLRDANNNIEPAGVDVITVWFTAGNINGTDMTDAQVEHNLAANPIQITVTP
jgi:hypothetical protein